MPKTGATLNNKSAGVVIIRKAWDFPAYAEMIRYAKLSRIRLPSETVQYIQNEFCKDLEDAGRNSTYPQGVWGVGNGSGCLNLYSGDGSDEFKMLNLWGFERDKTEILGRESLTDDILGYTCVASTGRLVTPFYSSSAVGVVCDQQTVNLVSAAILCGSAASSYNVSATFIQPQYSSGSGSFAVNTSTGAATEYGFASGNGAGLYHVAIDSVNRYMHRDGVAISFQVPTAYTPLSPNPYGVLCFVTGSGQVSGGRVGSKAGIFIGSSAMTSLGMPLGIYDAYTRMNLRLASV